MEKTKILWIGDGGVATGFARVNHSIIENLPDRFEVHHLAVNYNGDPYPAEHDMYPARLGGDILGLNRIESLLEKIKPDLIFILNDPWLVNDYLTKIPVNCRVIAYIPVDAKYLNPRWIASISKINQAVTYTEFGKQEFLSAYPNFSHEIEVVPHGFDADKFYPIGKAVARDKLGLPLHSFIVFNGNRNQPRKRMDLTIKGFAEFAKDKEDVYLYLHTGVEDAGWNIIELSKRYNILEKLILTDRNLNPQSYVSDEQLNIIYNCADVGINTSMGEGWGLVSIEQACTGVAQIVPDFSATSEIYPEDTALKLKIDRFEPHERILTEGGVVSLDDVTNKLQIYYENPELRLEHAENLFNHFHSSQFEWKNITEKWVEIFDRVLTEEPRAQVIQESQKENDISDNVSE